MGAIKLLQKSYILLMTLALALALAFCHTVTGLQTGVTNNKELVLTKITKTMKKILFAVAALFISTMSFAQGFGGGFGGGQGMSMNPEDMAKRQADRLKEQIELTQVQYDSIYNYYLKSSKEQAARREQMQNGGGQMPGEGDMQAMMEQMQKQRQAQEAKIKSFLTDDQKKKYDEIQEQRRQQRQQGGQGGFGGGFGGGMPQGGFGGGRPQ